MSEFTSHNALSRLPMGFGMALLQNEKARTAYDKLPLNVQIKVLNGTHGIRSKAEMQQYVADIPNMS
jgi:hypothetical protein